ncbi:MAG: hypothetical protein PHS41_10245 [Victivallaceae bacterium]|nr:hypothetical protein [Victivallaceae bacterium]
MFDDLIARLDAEDLRPAPTVYHLGEVLDLRGYRSGANPHERGAAKLTLDGNMLHTYGAFRDSDIYNRATSDNAHTWETGDAFEFFFQASGHEDYYEVHTTPEMIRLQLHIASHINFRLVPFEQKLVDIKLKVRTRIFREKNLWLGEHMIDLKELHCETPVGARFCFARYNYSHTDEAHPEITSSFLCPGVTVHDPPAWHVIG